MLIGLTGANGFVGETVANLLIKRGYNFRIIGRKFPNNLLQFSRINFFEIGEINDKTNWTLALQGVDTIIHCAAKYDINPKESFFSNLTNLRKVNVDGVVQLMNCASKLRVKRIVYISSTKVYGKNIKNTILSVCDIPNPVDPYSISKWEAEKYLVESGKKLNIDFVIIRSPPVYGPGVKGKFLNLLNLIYKGIPLPFGSIKKLYSLVSVFNLADLVILCADHAKASNETFLVSDNEDLSLAQLITKISIMMGKSPRLLPVPIYLLKLLGTFTRNSLEIDNLTRSSQIDISKTTSKLKWTPILSLDEALLKTIKWYQCNQ
jgi:nucleoside-diphosphate-sugar epimerase